MLKRLSIYLLLFLCLLSNVQVQNDSVYIKQLFGKAYNYEFSQPDSAGILKIAIEKELLLSLIFGLIKVSYG